MWPRTLWRLFDYFTCETTKEYKYNWALRLGGPRIDGYRLLVLDADSQDAVRWCLDNLPLTVMVSTAHNGRAHFYFLMRRRPRFRCIHVDGNDFDRIEIKCRKQDLVMRAGSIVTVPDRDAGGHFFRTVEYKYVEGHKPTDLELGILTDEHRVRLNELGKLGKRLKKQRQRECERCFEDDSEGKSEHRRTQNKRKHLPLPLRGTSKGDRDNTCTHLVGFLWSKGFSKDDILDVLLRWNDQCRPPWGSSEGDLPKNPAKWIDDKINRLCNYHLRRNHRPTKQERCEMAVWEWADTQCELTRNVWELQHEVIDAFLLWAEINGYETWTRKRIGTTIKNLLSLKETIYRNTKRGIRGQRRLKGIRLLNGCHTRSSCEREDQ